MFDREPAPRPGAPPARRRGDDDGKPLEAGVRARLEPAFGVGLAHLRVHDDARSRAEVAARGADGAALGRDLAFAPGSYRPGTLAGDALIAHEVAHALQQGGASASRDEGALEADADRSALAALLPGAAAGAARPRRSAMPGLSLASCGRTRPGSRLAPSTSTSPAPPATTPAPTPASTTVPAPAAEDWDFTVEDLRALRGRGGDVSMAPDSGWLPAPLQENLLATLRALLDPSRSPRATDGVNVRDWYHGHFGVPSGSWTAELQRLQESYRATEEREERTVFGEGMREVTAANLESYREAMGRITAAARPLLERAVTIPGAAVLYHTYEFTGGVAAGAARRNWKSPLDTNVPEGVAGGTSAVSTGDLGLREVLQFAFLVDIEGRVHARPGSFFELRTVTGEPGMF